MSLIHYQPGGGVQVVGSSKGSGGGGPPGPPGPAGGTDVYISAYSTVSQEFADGGTAPVDVIHHATSIALNASLNGGNIQVNLAGVYKILFSAQFRGKSGGGGGGGGGKLVIFVRKGAPPGTPIPYSATTTSFKGVDEGVITVEIIERLNANDIISIAAYATAAPVELFYTPATTVGGLPVPACPGIITDVFKIAN